jgi:cytochrome c oxidase subunit 4
MADEATPTGTATETEAEPQEAPPSEVTGDAPGALEPAGVSAPPAHPVQQQVMLPGEVRPHPQPAKYVMIAAILVIVTAAEVGLYYLQEELAEGLIIVLLLSFALVKFFLVASWYMHLRTDKPIFRNFFVLGIVSAISLYLVVLATLQVFGS